MSSKIKLPENVRKEINWLVDKYTFVLIEFKKGNAYLLFQHHRYLDPWKDAPRSKICKSPAPIGVDHFVKPGIIYLTEHI